MKRSYDIYRPGRLIRDVTAVPEYYQAEDVKVSPFATVGELSEAPGGTATETFDAKPVEPAKPVFTTDMRGRLRRPPAAPKPTDKAVTLAKPSDPISNEEVAVLAATPFSAPDGYRRAAAHLQRYRTRLVAAATAWLVGAGRFINRQEWLPHKYLWNRGWVIDRRETIRETGFLVTPLAVLLVLVGVAAFTRPSPAPRQPTAPHNGGVHQQTYATGSDKTVSTPKPKQQPGNRSFTTATSGVGNLIVPVASTPTSSGQVAAYPPTSSASGTGGTTGGRGGGYSGSGTGSTPTSGSGTSIPGVTSPVPITIPGQSVQSGGKQIVGTDPVGITLN